MRAWCRPPRGYPPWCTAAGSAAHVTQVRAPARRRSGGDADHMIRGSQAGAAPWTCGRSPGATRSHARRRRSCAAQILHHGDGRVATDGSRRERGGADAAGLGAGRRDLLRFAAVAMRLWRVPLGLQGAVGGRWRVNCGAAAGRLGDAICKPGDEWQALRQATATVGRGRNMWSRARSGGWVRRIGDRGRRAIIGTSGTWRSTVRGGWQHYVLQCT
jgi:hypothetical protein